MPIIVSLIVYIVGILLIIAGAIVFILELTKVMPNERNGIFIMFMGLLAVIFA